MTTYWFPDNTVLCNFASVDSLPLLEKILEERGRWVEAIAFEASRSARTYPALAGIPLDGWLGEPVEIIDRHDIAQVERIRRAVFGGRPDQPLRHLGEAQTCYVLRQWPDLAGSCWISDDRQSLRFAQLAGIPVGETADLVGIAVARSYLSRGDGYALLEQMIRAGRHPRLPPHRAQL